MNNITRSSLIVVAILLVGIAIPKLTVRDLMPADERLQRCINYALKESYDNPIERIGLLLGKSRVAETDWKGSVNTESYTIFRIPMRGSLTVFCDQEGLPQESSLPSADEFVFVEGMAIEYLGTFHDSSLENGLKSYRSKPLDISLNYPENYRLFEGQGQGSYEYYVITISPEPYISEIIARDADTEWPASIQLLFYREPSLSVSLEEWIRAKRQSNFDVSDPAQKGALTPITVAGVPALQYEVVGLYDFEYTAFLHGEWVVLAANPGVGEHINQDFQTVLSSIALGVTD